jgi:hypothetical protein
VDGRTSEITSGRDDANSRFQAFAVLENPLLALRRFEGAGDLKAAELPPAATDHRKQAKPLSEGVAAHRT